MKSRLLQKVLIRRKGEWEREFPTRSLVPEIQSGELLASDEFSGDGQQWVRLDRHHQLGRYFDPALAVVEPADPIEQDLQELAGMLRELDAE